MKDKIAIKIVNAAGKLLAENCSEGETALVYDGEYCQGDVILVELSEVPAHYWVQLDDAREKSLVYLTGNVSYVIPFGDARLNISPKAFCGAKHLLTVRKARTYEVESYRNLALNVWDQHHMNNMYPHAYANVETRGEAVFAAQNAIDGVVVNNSHGEWPYASWGINQQEDAQITVDFGRDIETFAGSCNGPCKEGFAHDYFTGMCEPCATGMYCPGGYNGSLPCPKHSVPNTEQTGCVKCDDQLVSIGGFCQQCPIHQYFNVTINDCDYCPNHMRQDVNDTTKCVRCPEGQFRDKFMWLCVTVDEYVKYMMAKNVIS